MTRNGFLDYAVREHTLPNGLRVVLNPDRTTPVVAVNLWYDVGSRDEREHRTGLAHLFEHLMFQGSPQVRSGEHLSSIQNAGGTCNATTWFDRTNYFETVPRGALDLALWLESDRMGGLLKALTQENLDTQREVVKEEKRQRYDNTPYGDLFVHLLSLNYPTSHPYAHPVIGSMTDLESATLEDAHRFFEQWYGPNNAVLTLAGDIDPDDGLARVSRYFEHIGSRTPPPSASPAPLPSHVDVPRTQVSNPVPADLLTLSWRIPAGHSPTVDALDIALDVLGGSEVSRLHQRLVRTDALCTSAGSSALGLNRGNSLALAQAQALTDVPLDHIERTINEEVARFCDDGPTPQELDQVRIQFERSWLSQCARVEARADLLSAATTIDDDPHRINSRVEEFSAITATEVREAAQRYLAPAQRAALEYHRSTPEPSGGS
ncbi:MAG: M16 family metallopeptidase [Propioniciclava sp.]